MVVSFCAAVRCGAVRWVALRCVASLVGWILALSTSTPQLAVGCPECDWKKQVGELQVLGLARLASVVNPFPPFSACAAAPNSCSDKQSIVWR